MGEMKGQTVGICGGIGGGVAALVMSLTTIDSLSTTQTTCYERYYFADVFTHVKRAPQSLAVRLAEIPGVTQVQTRIVADVTLDLPGLAEPATGRLISLPDRREPVLNRLHLRERRMPEAGTQRAVVG